MSHFPFKAPLTILYLPEEDVRDGRWEFAIDGAFHFLDVVSNGAPTMDDVDANLMGFWEFVHYIAEVANGGHGQYLDNRRPSVATLETLMGNIDRLGSPHYAAVFADFVHKVRTLPVGKDHTDGSFTGCELLAPLDKRYFELWNSDRLERHMVLFLVKQAWVRLLPQQTIAAELQSIQNQRRIKRSTTMPSAQEIGRFVDQIQRFFKT